MRLPTLSVIVPNYNHSKYLPQCIEAIMSQSVPADEVIVIDDCSTDNSVEVIEGLVKRYPRLKLVRNEVNRGVSLTINRGFEMAIGEYVFSTGADDQVSPGLFEKSLQLLAKHPQAAFSGAICRFEDVKSGNVYYLGAGNTTEACYLSPDDMVRRLSKGRLVIFTSTAIFRKDAVKRVGYMHPDLRWHSDWFACTVTGLRHGVCFVPEVLGVFRVMPSGYSKTGMRRSQSQMEVLRTVLARLDEKEYEDVRTRVRDSAALAPFGKEMLALILFHQRFWKHLGFAYLCQAVWWTIRIEAKKVLPDFVARLYFKLAGYSRPAKSEASVVSPK